MKQSEQKQEHEHDWGPYEDVPFGENPGRFRRCQDPSCRVIGYLRFSAMKRGDKCRRIVPYKCAVHGCGNDATGRLRGRRGPRAAYWWVCDEHHEPAP